jgi:hypothetical protein
MKLRFRLSILLLTFYLLLNSQNRQSNFSLILDFIGNSGLYSLNGEVKIGGLKSSQLNARIGFGYLPIYSGQFIGIPIGLNIITGTKKHHFEMGLGTSYIKGMQNLKIDETNSWLQSERIYLTPSIGYRFDNLNNGLIFKIYYSPLISVFDLNKMPYELDNSPYPIPSKNELINCGVSVGYRFTRK